MGRRRFRSRLPQFVKAAVRIPELVATWAGPASESLALRHRAGARPARSSSLAVQAPREQHERQAAEC